MAADTFSDNEPGSQQLTPFVFEQWADPEDQHTAVVTEPHVTSEGRRLQPGDLITPRQARAERVAWQPLGAHQPRDAGEFSQLDP